jgi:hypothetical protein
MLVGPPGVGKSGSVASARHFIGKLDGFHVGPVSITGASLIDAMAEAKREQSILGSLELQHYNSLLLLIDDLQSALHKWDPELVANLTIFYDTTPYIQTRRTNSLKVEINSPQLSMLIGTTNSQLLNLLPSGAWEQGFMSRTIMVHAAKRPQNPDLFAEKSSTPPKELEHDLKCIFALRGQFAAGDDFRDAINSWRNSGESPRPTHPRLEHYCTRRVAHLLKLAMVSSADRGDSLSLNLHDFERAKSWLISAEQSMPDVFSAAVAPDAKNMDEIRHLIGKGEVMDAKLIRLISDRVPSHQVKRMIEIMVESEQLEVRLGPNGRKMYRVKPDVG